jgi:hypothetical protein
MYGFEDIERSWTANVVTQSRGLRVRAPYMLFIGLVTAAFAGLCIATTLKEVSFEDLVGSSDQIVSGHVTKSWVSWGSQHRFIWTRYEVAVEDVMRGPKTSTIMVSEPGGVLEGKGMSVESAVRYSIGDYVVLFLHTYPNGDKRTVGWSQGKFTIDDRDRVHSNAGSGFAIARFGVVAGTPISTLDGVAYTQLRMRVADLLKGTVVR